MARRCADGSARRALAPQRHARACVAEIATGTRVHGGDELKPRRQLQSRRRARDRDGAGLERLAQRLEHAPIELRQLIEEQHAVMRQRDFARANLRATADDGLRRGRMMRRAKRPPHAAARIQAHARRSRRCSRLRAPRWQTAAAAVPAAVPPACSCRCPVARSLTRCERRPPQRSARAWPAIWPDHFGERKPCRNWRLHHGASPATCVRHARHRSPRHRSQHPASTCAACARNCPAACAARVRTLIAASARISSRPQRSTRGRRAAHAAPPETIPPRA